MEEISLSEENRQPLAMAEYVYNAMAKARYQVLEDGTYYADIFLCPGVWAIGETVDECREALRDALSEWLIAAYEGDDQMFGMGDVAWMNPPWYRIGD
jgi:predicted RNase H-like HicB family nuclease